MKRKSSPILEPKIDRKHIRINIFLEPNLLEKNYRLCLLGKAKNLLEGKCDSVHGYIGKVYDNIEILGNSVSTTNPGVYFQVKLEVHSVRPELGQKYKGIINKITPVYISVEILDNVSVFIPKMKIKIPGAEIKVETGLFSLVYNPKKIETYRVGDTMSVSIENIEYTKQKFNCIGKLIV